jgi:hypothetical protein
MWLGVEVLDKLHSLRLTRDPSRATNQRADHPRHARVKARLENVVVNEPAHSPNRTDALHYGCIGDHMALPS